MTDKTLTLELSTSEALGLLGTVQLAFRHPTYPSRPTAKQQREVMARLQKMIVEAEPALSFVCAAGWNKEFDR